MKTSRTAITTHQVCPRKRYWQNHYNGIGIEPRRQAVPLVWGSGLHVGVASLLLGHSADAAVADALLAYAQQCADREFDLDDLESQSFVYAEGKALIEGFIRAWAIARLPDFIGTYEVLEVEQEGVWKDWAEGIDLAYRPDALLRRRNTGELYVFNLKSSYAWGEREQKASRYNVQGLSELAALENRLGEKVAGIQDEIFIKGSRLARKKDDNEKWQMTFLVHPWLKQGITSDDDAWAWQYYFEKNGRNTSLGNSYSRVSVWEHMTMKEWVQLLADGEVQDSFPLSELFATPIPHERNSVEVNEWLTQARAQELGIRNSLHYLSLDNGSERRGALDVHFPMYRHSCFSYQRTCAYAPLCHERLGPECGLFVPRADHHAEIITD